MRENRFIVSTYLPDLITIVNTIVLQYSNINIQVQFRAKSRITHNIGRYEGL